MEPQFLFLSFFLSAPLLYFLLALYFNNHNHHRLPPSPRWRLPILGHMHLLGPLIHQSLHTLALQLGPFFSLHFASLPCIIVSSPHYAKLVLHTYQHAFINRMETIAVKRLTYDSSLAFARYGEYWRFIKKLSMNELLGSRSINNFRHLRQQETRGFLRVLALKAKAGEAVNVTEELLKLTNNVISRMMLGEAEEARDVVRGVTKIFGEFNVSDFVWLLRKFDLQGFGKRIEDLFERLDTMVERIICKREEMRRRRKRVENGDCEVRDFLDVLLDCVEDENSQVKINRVHVKALIVDFLTAGTDTTAISTEYALVELMKNPLVLEKARKEIESVVGKNKVVEECDCENLPYLKAIVKETFRLHPPVPMVNRICVEECKIENYVIPKNTLLFVNVWSMGRNPKYWEKPLEFRPERFMMVGEGGDSNGVMDVMGQHFELLPFGCGRRLCPGVSLVMQEVPALLGAIIQCFDFQVIDSKGFKVDGKAIDMNERPGLTAPRAQDLLCLPLQRSNIHQTT
ncbi:licodione synthase-like [Vigna radiata var. radiata]|uniref:Licodione synthase-like n=1 Tax=Vigna radiata var. radiata TaxID=3916 RepID=A0A1S3TZ41_VIGRR|nr:licodione synthase-like [Vigna radiata var. radiata]